MPSRLQRAFSPWPNAWATDVGFEVVNGALQLHGEPLLRHVRVHQILEGGNESCA
jgi:alkylation response protein AidB-like acyl-CoA dehydrogenase